MILNNLIKIDESADKVVIVGQVVMRPDYISPKEWLEFWEKIKRGNLGAY